MNMTNEKLKPCPFCGTTWTGLDTDLGGVHYRGFVFCDNCGAQGPLADTRTKEEAWDLWNNRFTPEKINHLKKDA